MTDRLQGKVAAVTGSASGIGLASAEAMLAALQAELTGDGFDYAFEIGRAHV